MFIRFVLDHLPLSLVISRVVHNKDCMWSGGRGYLTILLFLKAEWALSQQPMRPKAEWAIDSETVRARGIIIVFVISNQLVKNIKLKQL